MVFLIISIIVFNCFALIMPKKLNKIEIYATSFFAFSLDISTDIILDLKYDMYGYFEKGVQFSGLLATVGLYPAVSTIFLNLFPYNRALYIKILNIVGWSLFCLGFEWFSIKSGFFYHREWKYLYSAPINPFLLMVLLINLKFIKKLEQHSIQTRNVEENSSK